MKHDNVSMYDAFVWNWSKSAVCDDPIFITSCINDAIGDEIRWPTIEDRVMLGAQIWWNSMVALGSLMAHSSIFTNLGMMEPQGLVQWVKEYLLNEQHHGC
jgi:hypothetical protein